MSVIIFKKGTTAQNDSYKGQNGEITIDTTKKTIRVHDGSIIGGAEMALSDLSNTNVQDQLDTVNSRLDTLEGDGAGSITQALQDANTYTDNEITNEAQIRSLADDIFNDLVNGLINDVDTLQNDLSTETNNRSNADTNLQNQINLLASGADLLTLQNRVDALEDIDSGNRLDIVETALAQEILDRTDAVNTEIQNRIDADFAIQTELDNTQSGAGLNIDGSYSIPEGNTYLTGTDSLRSAILALDISLATEAGNISDIQDQLNTEIQNRIDADNAIDLRIDDVELHHLHSNSFYANNGVTDIQTEIDNVGATQNQVIFVTSGSFAGATISINNKIDMAIVAPDIGDNMATLSGGRALTIDGTSEKIRIANLKIEGAVNITGSKGRHYFSDCEFQGGVNIDGTTDATNTFIVFQDCTFKNQNVNLSNLTNCIVYFNNCNFENRRVVVNNCTTSPYVAIISNSLRLNVLQTNFADGIALVGRIGYANQVVKTYTTSTNFINALNVETSFTGSYNELNDLPTLVTASTDLSDTADLLRTSDKGVANGVAELDANGLIPNHHLPPLALSKPYVVDTIIERDALTGIETGDVAIVVNDTDPDNNGNYIYDGDTPSWIKLYNATAPVDSVNGSTGTVTLYTGDITEGVGANSQPANKWFTDQRAIDAVVTSNINTNDKAPSTQTVKTYVTGITDGLNTRLTSVENDAVNHATIAYVDNGLAGKVNTSDYTASDVLTKIKTVDGSGSGLDADLLDGLDASDFVKMTTDQTISGIKTFSSAPIVPDQSALDNSTKSANTKYVDTAIQTVTDLQGASGQVLFKGNYNPTTNTPSLTTAKKGYLYVASDNGTLDGANLNTGDQILFIKDVTGGVVAGTDFVVDSGLANGSIIVRNITSNNSTMISNAYHIYQDSNNWGLKLPALDQTQVGYVMYLRHRGTGVLSLTRFDTSYTANFYFNNTLSVNSISLSSTGEYIFRCSSIQGTTITWEVTCTNKNALRTTDDLTEGSTNKYASATNVRPLLSAGTGISYDNGTGAITNSAPYSDSSARLALSAGTGISYDNSSGAISLNATIDNLSDVVISDPSSNQILSYNGTNWVNTTNDSVGRYTPTALSAGSVALVINKYYFTSVSGIIVNATMPTPVVNGDTFLIHNLGGSTVTLSSLNYYWNGAYSGVGQNFVITTNDLFRFTAYVDGATTYWYISVSPSQNLRTTTNIAEGTNEYFTEAKAKTATVVNSMAGSQTDQAPSVSSVKAYYTAGTGISISSGQISASLSGFSIDALSDVDTTTSAPTSGQALAWNGTNWTPQSISGFSIATGNRSISTNTVATATSDETYYIATSALTVTLPTPSSSNVGKKIIVKSYTNGAVTIASNSGSQIIYDSTSASASVVHTANFPGFSTTFICLEVGSGTYFWVVV